MNRNSDGIAAAEVRGLIREAQAGSQVACSALRRQYDPLVQTMLNGFYSSCRTAQERKDLAEEAEYAFLGALSSYDVGQTEVTFGLYARVCLRNGLVSAVRHIEPLRRLHVVPLAEQLVPDREDVAAGVAAEERFAALCRFVQGSLSEYENRVWWAYVAGTPVSQIAAALGKDEKSVHNAVYRIRRKLRCRLETRAEE